MDVFHHKQDLICEWVMFNHFLQLIQNSVMKSMNAVIKAGFLGIKISKPVLKVSKWI